MISAARRSTSSSSPAAAKSAWSAAEAMQIAVAWNHSCNMRTNSHTLSTRNDCQPPAAPRA
eukprot:3749069-Prymnesium_polylepis.1